MWLTCDRSEATDPEQTGLVMKVVSGGRRARALRAVAGTWSQVSHPNLLPLLATWDEPVPGTEASVVALMPWMAGGNLRDLLDDRGTLTPGEVVALLEPVSSAVDHLHQHGLTHGDIKPENILLSGDGEPRLADPVADVGLATPAYLAPEVLDGARSTAIDVYALGVVAYELLTGRHPHRGGPAEVLAAAAGGAHRRLTTWPGVPDGAAEMVESALDPDPDNRPGSAGVLMAGIAAAVERAAVVLPGTVPVAFGRSGTTWQTLEIDSEVMGLTRNAPESMPESRARLRAWPIRRRSQSRRCR